MTAAPVGRPEKYETHVQPHLEIIKAWREAGMKLDSIAKELHIAPSTLYLYQQEHSELLECLQTARDKLHKDMLIRAEDSLYEKLEPRTIEVTTTEERVFYNQDGEQMIENKTITREQYVPADTTAIIWTLKNRDPDNWRDRTELDARVLHGVIPQPLAPVRGEDLVQPTLEGEIVEDETDNSV